MIFKSNTHTIDIDNDYPVNAIAALMVARPNDWDTFVIDSGVNRGIAATVSIVVRHSAC